MIKLYKITASNSILNKVLTFAVHARNSEHAEDLAFKALDDHWNGSHEVLESTTLDEVEILA